MEYNKPTVIGFWGTGNSQQRRLIYDKSKIAPTVQASWGMGGGNVPSVLVTPNTPELYYCRGCDNMYVWINNALSAVPRNLIPTSIMTADIKMANTRRAKSVKKPQATSQSSKNGELSNDTMQSTATELRGGILE